MTSYLALLVIGSCYFAACEAAISCEQKPGLTYLEVAANMIEKVKKNITTCLECKKCIDCKPANLTEPLLDCSDLLRMGQRKSGVYKIRPVNRITNGKILDVYCDMETDGGGWTLIQKRGNFHRAEDYFYKDWKSYKAGFGDIDKDFWLGNDNIFGLTNQKVYTVRFDMTDVEGESRYAQYDTFWIDDERHQYRLHFTDYRGNAGDSLAEHNDNKFSTKDVENDNQRVQNCAQLYKGGWWYNGCHSANPNGLYKRGKHKSFADGIIWNTWKGYYESYETFEIKIRPKDFTLTPILIPM